MTRIRSLDPIEDAKWRAQAANIATRMKLLSGKAEYRIGIAFDDAILFINVTDAQIASMSQDVLATHVYQDIVRQARP